MGHIHEKIDFCVEVFIVYKDKVLLKKHKKFKDIWLSVGGHIELHEDPNQAALREVKEEVGLDVRLVGVREQFDGTEGDYTDLVSPVALGKHRVNETHEHVVLVYFATSGSDAVVPEDEGAQWKWVTKEDLATMDLRPNVRNYAEAALDRLAA